ncbi:asparagine synthetase B family protein [Actinocatenispora rupis]|uniref:asparagine synthase (glutamine-hydrolyzing) n=1 Tax=Actinocatenispora rupis TaxID=519421 RepID=A0A8J3N8R0_9ACTN|nr:asparagine synthase-related protein [Actinocatenispora rupis]GID10356.1 asparagine synthetase B [Actinocatenispora rupis]
MSTIAAVLARDPAALLDRVTAPGRYPGSLATGAAVDGPCGLGAAVLPATPEDTIEAQPVTADGLRVAFAGRLDNPAELRAVLGVHPRRPVTDARLVAAAYRRWGTACPTHLIGSFALLVWDGDRLFGAVDHLASRTLFWSARAGTVVVASTVRQVLAGTPGADLDDDYLLASLCLPTGAPLQSDRTAYAGVHRLLRGEALTVAPDGHPRTWRYWRPEDLPERRGPVAELGEELRATLATAVRAQSRSAGKVMCTLSGGLDSSTVTGLVAGLADAGRLPAPGFAAMSLAFGEGTEADERAYRRMAEERFGVTAVDVDGAACWHFQDIAPGGAAPVPDEPFVSWSAYAETRGFADAATDSGCTTVLFGHGGDELWAGSEHFLADLVRRGRLAATWRRGRELAGLKNRTYSSALRKLALGPLLGQVGIRWDGGSDDLDRYWYRPPAPPWVTPDPRRRAAVERIWRDTTTLGVRPVSRAHELAWIRAASVAPVLNDGVFHPRGLDLRMPFYDRRVVELALSVPGEHKLRVADGTRITKLVLREAARDVLPAGILARRTKASLSVSAAEGLRREWPRILGDGRLQVAERGLVDRDPVLRDLRAARMGQWQNIGHLTALVVLELWLRHRTTSTEGGDHDGGAGGDLRNPAARTAGQRRDPGEG